MKPKILSSLVQSIHSLSRFQRRPVLAALLLAAVQVPTASAVQMDFNSTALTSFDPAQDAGAASVQDQGDRLTLDGNSWKKADIPYQVSANTVVEFDFRSAVPAEISGIGFETDNVSTEDYFFQLTGSQTWGHQNFRNYSGTGWKHYVIPIGQFYTGMMKHLAFANDHNVNGSNAQCEFRHVQIYQSDAAGAVNFTSYPVTGYDPAQDAGTASIQDGGNRIVLTGNAWKKINLPYRLTRNTVIEFEFQGVVQGEVHAIGFDTDNYLSEPELFQLWGSQNSGIQDRRTYGGAGWTRYTIPVGEYYSGQMNHLVFVNDHDVPGSSAQGQFRSVRVYEACMPADRFVDSIGLGIKAWQGTTVTEGVELVARVQDLGVRHVRDWLAVDQPQATTIWTNLKNAGIDFCFTLSNWAALANDTQRLATLNAYKSYLKDPTKGNLIAGTAFIEGTNEPNLPDGTLKAGTAYFNTTLTSLFRSDPATQSVPILASALANISNITAAHAALGDVTALVEFGNIHPYPGGSPPHVAVGEELARQQVNTANYPVIATETGYHNLLTSTSGHNPASEEATSVYLPRLFFEYSRRGVYRTYFYQLADDDAPAEEGRFGLVRPDYVTPKPAYYSLRNLIQLMKDPGTSFAAVPISLSISGASDVRSCLYQKRNGKYFLALWREVSVWSNSPREPLFPASANITVSFPSLRAKVDLYKPSISTEIQSSFLNVTTLTTEVGGHLQILEF